MAGTARERHPLQAFPFGPFGESIVIVQSQERREAVAVEIAYAILPSILLLVAVFVIEVVIGWMLGVRGSAWNIGGTVAFIAAILVACARTIVVLVRARRRGL